MKTLLIVVAVLFAATSLSALGTGNRVTPSNDEGYTTNFQDTTKKKKDKKKKDSTEKRDTALAQYHH